MFEKAAMQHVIVAHVTRKERVRSSGESDVVLKSHVHQMHPNQWTPRPIKNPNKIICVLKQFRIRFALRFVPQQVMQTNGQKRLM